MYTAYFYVEARHGSVPVREYLDQYESVAGRFIALITLFEEHGRLPFPYTSHIKGPIWELRIRDQRNHHRVLYVIHEGQRIILLTAFTKRTQKIPAREIIRAEMTLHDYLVYKQIIPVKMI